MPVNLWQLVIVAPIALTTLDLSTSGGISVGRVLSQPIRNLSGLPLFAVVALAALPTAQNTFNYALRFERAVPVARDTVLITTVLSIPALVVIAVLLAPH